MKTFKSIAHLFLMVFVAVLSLTLAQSVYAWTIVDDATGGDCTSIGKWKAKTKTCTLQTDLSEGIIIDSDSITLECDGHSISNDYEIEIGIDITGREGLSIKNCIVEAWNTGIRISSSNDITLQGNNVFAMGAGILISMSDYNTLQDNSVLLSVSYEGIVLSYSNHNILKDNISEKCLGHGFSLYNSNNNYLKGNISRINDLAGFLLRNSNNNYLSRNSANYNNSWGFYVVGNDNIFRHNECFGNFSGGSLPLGLCSPQLEGQPDP